MKCVYVRFNLKHLRWNIFSFDYNIRIPRKRTQISYLTRIRKYVLFLIPFLILTGGITVPNGPDEARRAPAETRASVAARKYRGARISNRGRAGKFHHRGRCSTNVKFPATSGPWYCVRKYFTYRVFSDSGSKSLPQRFWKLNVIQRCYNRGRFHNSSTLDGGYLIVGLRTEWYGKRALEIEDPFRDRNFEVLELPRNNHWFNDGQRIEFSRDFINGPLAFEDLWGNIEGRHCSCWIILFGEIITSSFYFQN